MTGFILMITITIIALGVLLVAGSVALLHAACRAPKGYEDELDFHEGVDSWPQRVTVTAAPVPSNKNAVSHDCVAP
jgi:hypothetical protein